MNTLDLKAIRLGRGAHRSAEEGMCAMEAVAYLAGEPWSDSPKCVSPVIAAFLRRWNDDLDDDDRQMLKPYLPRLVGTNTGSADEKVRVWLLIDWMVRVYLLAWLRLARLQAQAAAIESLPPLTGSQKWEAARPVVQAVAKAAAHARDAHVASCAWAQAWTDAWYAATQNDAWVAAAWVAAARDATARDAAWAAAAVTTARDAAARDAAWAATAVTAVRVAARDAAWVAVARDAAARDAAWAVMKPTVVGLQRSVLHLLERMIAVGNGGTWS